MEICYYHITTECCSHFYSDVAEAMGYVSLPGSVVFLLVGVSSSLYLTPMAESVSDVKSMHMHACLSM